MAENIYCPSCGELTTSAKFCQSCGAHLGREDVKVEQPIYLPVQPQPQVIVIQQPQVEKESNSYADTAMIFAILGICCIPFLGGFLAMILGFIGAFNPYKRGTAILSLIIGFVTSVLPLVWLLMIFI